MNGPRYIYLLKNGFKESDDGIQLEIDDSYIRNNPRPKKQLMMYEHEIVKNPDTGRLIKTGKATFKKVARKYNYDPNRNRFYAKIVVINYKIRESNSAMRGFTKQYVINGRVGNDAKIFLIA